jgi:endo-1,4-beta-xylanase
MSELSNSHWSRRQFHQAALAMGAAAALPGWLGASDCAASQHITGPDSLRAHAAARGLMYGIAVNPALLDVEGVAAGSTGDQYTRIVQAQANILVAENAMKWGGLRPSPSIFDFTLADRMMRFAKLTGQRARGHNLCWHEGLPPWFRYTANKDNARLLLTQHIETVAGRYRGQLHSWDVVNEAINPADGRPDGLRKSPWLELIGADYLDLAFRTAAKADPQAKLTYNDYGFELDTPEQSTKRDQILQLLRGFKERGVPIHAVGIQSHLQADGPQPGAGLLSFIREAAKMGLEAFVTEMDVNTHSLAGGAEEQDAAVALVYRNYLGLMLAEPNLQVALTWGITSAHSWLNESRDSWAKRADGSRLRPLLFDDDIQPTSAFSAARSAIDAARPLTAKLASS